MTHESLSFQVPSATTTTTNAQDVENAIKRLAFNTEAQFYIIPKNFRVEKN